jgi:signal transduction histidine kinase
MPLEQISIMETEQLLKREQLAKQICAQLNNFVDLKNILTHIINQLKELSGFEAVSIRLHDEGDYPYFVFNGFASSFIQKENSVCSDFDCQAEDKTQKRKLECLCGNVIRGNFDKTKSYYTSKGSFYTNGSTHIIPELNNNEKSSNLRNFCNACGYESIGLFPIKTREENIGLIQLNDKRNNMFTDDLIEFLEMIGEQIGVAIENATLYERLKEQNATLQRNIDELTNAQIHLQEAKKLATLADLVTGLNHEIYQPVSDAIGNLEKIQQNTKNLSRTDIGSRLEFDSLIYGQREVYYNLNKVRNLIKSFRSIALDQFQESRHLINLYTFFNDIIRIIKPSLKQKDIIFQIDCNENSEILIFSGVLSQVILILIQNAYNHAFRSVNSGKIVLGCTIGKDDFLIISVSDNGCGIDESIRHKIFEPFFTTDRKNHSGLGLHTASNLVENKLKGRIEIESTSTSGTTFVVKIPF